MALVVLCFYNLLVVQERVMVKLVADPGGASWAICRNMSFFDNVCGKYGFKFFNKCFRNIFFFAAL